MFFSTKKSLIFQKNFDIIPIKEKSPATAGKTLKKNARERGNKDGIPT
jgi:hypothetical protein